MMSRMIMMTKKEILHFSTWGVRGNGEDARIEDHGSSCTRYPMLGEKYLLCELAACVVILFFPPGRGAPIRIP